MGRYRLSSGLVAAFVTALVATATLASLPSRGAAQPSGFAQCMPVRVDVMGSPGGARVEVACNRRAASAGNTSHTPWEGAMTVSRFAMPLDDGMAKRFLKLATLANTGGLVLGIHYRPDGSGAFPGCDDQTCRRIDFFSVGRNFGACEAYIPWREGGNWSFCTADCPCHVGQGDCDRDNQCSGDLVCRQGSWGAAYGLSPGIDTCQPRQCTAGACDPANGCLCFEGEGPCSTDEDCAGELICNAASGLCETCPAVSASAPRTNACSERCPCTRNEGDCDPDGGETSSMAKGTVKESKQCLSRNLRCVIDVGPDYGYPAEYDLCIPIYETSLAP